ncbi:MAG: class I SAM-dependent methyltransferase [Balneolaceae bacterium]
MKCNICGNKKNNKYYSVKEMMFGSRDEFNYMECDSCGCIQICEIPGNISEYYPADYYSFTKTAGTGLGKKLLIKTKSIRDKAAVFKRGLMGNILNSFFPNEVLNTMSGVLSKDQHILDAGCGKGMILSQLKEIGFVHLSGIDPFIENDIRYKNGLEIRKMSLQEVTGTWDIIMFHHSFEHMPNPGQILKLINAKLSVEGTAIIRIPVSGSFAWQEFGTDWVQLDAPRHFYLHTKKSMEIIADYAGLKISNIIYDSTDFQFWGSEQYKRDIPLNDPRSYSVNPAGSIFSKSEINSYRKKAKILNQKRQGDSAAFFLNKK